MKNRKTLIIGATALMLAPIVAPTLSHPKVQASENETSNLTVNKNQEEAQKILSATQAQSASDSSITEQPETTAEFNDDLNFIKQYVFVDSLGHIQLDNNVPVSTYEQYNLSALEAHFSNLNKKVDNNEITIKEDLTISSISMQSNSGVNHVQTWVGSSSYYTNEATEEAANAFEAIAYTGTIIGGAASLFPGINIIVSGISGIAGGYFGLLGSRMRANNNGNGVAVHMTYALIYNVEPL